MEPWLVALMAEMFALNAEIEGMHADNLRLEAREGFPLWSKEEFDAKAQSLYNISNCIHRRM